MSDPFFPHGLGANIHVGLNALAGIQPIKPTFEVPDNHIPDNYVTANIEKQKYLPPVTWSTLFHNTQWISLLAITLTPALAIYGMFTIPANMKTIVWR